MKTDIHYKHFYLPLKTQIYGTDNKVIGYKDSWGVVTVAFKIVDKCIHAAMDFCSPKDMFARKRANETAKVRLMRNQNSLEYNDADDANIVINGYSFSFYDTGKTYIDILKDILTTALSLKKYKTTSRLQMEEIVDYVPSWARRSLKRYLDKGQLPLSFKLTYQDLERPEVIDAIVKSKKKNRKEINGNKKDINQAYNLGLHMGDGNTTSSNVYEEI